jgi:hypothetical protein
MAVEALADETLAAIIGNAEQREAKRYIIFQEMNLPYQTCMRAQGLDFTTEFHTLYAGYRPDGTSGQWMGGLNRKPSARAIANAEAPRDELRGNLPADEKTPDFTAAKTKCGKKTESEQIVDLGGSGRRRPTI